MNQKTVCDFLLVNNTNLHLAPFARYCALAQYWSNYPFWQWVHLSGEFVLRKLWEYHDKSYIAY